VCAPEAVLVSGLLGLIRQHAGRAFAVRFEPGWLDGSVSPDRWGLRRAAATQPRSTAIVDLTPAEDEIRAGMHPKWRYNLGLAERRGVVVREGGEADLATFARLMQETARRDAFHAREAEYYAWAWRAFAPDAHLYLAEREGEPLAALMCFHFGRDASYLYGASSDSGRRDMPNHVLQWEALTRARAAGMRRYDLWGIPDAVGAAAAAGRDPMAVEASTDPLWGVWRFKRGLPVQVERTVGAWDLVISPTRHRVFTMVTEVRSRRRN
jgi:lipid II:glycine glycyltransferase (peptidoglycan interpeptide bridge formation enzyme)